MTLHPTSFNYALSGGELDIIRGVGVAEQSYVGKQHLSACPNTVVFQAQFFTGQSIASFAQEEFHNVTVGSGSDPKEGQRFLASTTNNKRKPYFRSVIRKPCSGSTIFFAETGIPQTVNDYIYVLDDYPIVDKVLRFIDGQGYFAWYDLPYRPLGPIVGSAQNNVGLRGAYAGYVDSITNKFRISMSALFYPCESAATITAWSVSLGDGTLISGSTSGSGTTTGTITADFPPGFRHVVFSATNSAGRTQKTYVDVWAEPRSGSATLINGFNGSSIGFDVERPGSLSSCSLDMYSTEMLNSLENTKMCVWDEEYNNGILGSVGGNVRYVGRLRKSIDDSKGDINYTRLLTTKWTLEGADSQLARSESFKTFTTRGVAPTGEWGYIASMDVYKIAALVLSEFSTFCNSNIINFDGLGNDQFPYPALTVSGNSILEVLNDLGISINAQLQTSGDGRATFVRHADYLTGAERNSLTKVADWSNQDYINTSLEIDNIRTAAWVDCWGGVDVGGVEVPLHSNAPGIARDEGEQDRPLSKQILSNVGTAAAAIENADRAGCHWLKESEVVNLPIMHRDSAGFIVPDIQCWHTWTMAAVDINLRNYAYTTADRWLCVKSSQTHSNKAGTKDVNNTYLLEKNGIGFGHDIPIILNNITPPPSIDPIWPNMMIITPPVDTGGPIVAQMGPGIKKLAAITNDNNLYITEDWDTSSPHWLSVGIGIPYAGGVGAVQLWIPDPFSDRYHSSTGLTYGWIIAQDKIWYGNLDTPSFAPFYTFRSGSALRSADASMLVAGHIIVRTMYPDGVWTTYATTGGNFVAEFQDDAAVGVYPPGVAYSSHAAVSGYSSIVGSGRKAVGNSGSSWAADAFIVPGSDCVADIVLPYASNPSDSIVYYGALDDTPIVRDYDFTLSDGGWTAEVPNAGSTSWIPGTGWHTSNNGVGFHVGLLKITSPTLSTFTLTKAEVWWNGNYLAFFGSAKSVTDNTGSIGTLSGGPGSFHDTLTTSHAGVTSVTVECDADSLQTPIFESAVTRVRLTGHLSNVPTIKRGSSFIPPLDGYGPWKSRGQVTVSPINPNILACAAGNASQVLAGIFVSKNGGSYWKPLVSPVAAGNRYERVFISGDKNYLLYLVGTNGVIGYSPDGIIVQDKRGDITAINEIIGISAL